MAEDGSKIGRKRVGMDIKCAGMGWDEHNSVSVQASINRDAIFAQFAKCFKGNGAHIDTTGG